MGIHPILQEDLIQVCNQCKPNLMMHISQRQTLTERNIEFALIVELPGSIVRINTHH